MSIRSPIRSPPRSPLTMSGATRRSQSSRSLSPPVSASKLHTTQLQQQQQQLDHTHSNGANSSNYFSATYGAPQYETQLNSTSVIDPSLVANADYTRVQLLLRIMECEKRFARVEERGRANEESIKMKLNELSSASSLAAERSSTLLQRLSEVELSSRESEISVQTLEQKCAIDNDLVQNLKSSVMTWRDETKKELRDEFTKNINLRNALHHQELVTLLDKQQEQTGKLVRSHELTSQGFHTKLQSMEAKWGARFEAMEQKYDAQAQELSQLKTKYESQKQKLHDVKQQHEQQLQIYSQQLNQLAQQFQQQVQQVLSDVEQQIAPIQQQLLLMSQLQQQQSSAHTNELEAHATQIQTQANQLNNVASQLEYSSTHLSDNYTKLESGYQHLRSLQLQIQNSVMALGEGLGADLAKLTQNVPTRGEMEKMEATIQANIGHTQANLEAQIKSGIHRLEQMVASNAEQTAEKLEEFKSDSIAPVQNEQGGIKQAISDSNHKLDQQGKILRRSSHAIQLIEEQLAAIQAKVLVAEEVTPLQMMIQQTSAAQQQQRLNSPLLNSPSRMQSASAAAAAIAYGNQQSHGFASPPPQAYQSPFNVALNLSDAAGLKHSPTRYTSGGPAGLAEAIHAATHASHAARSSSPSTSSTRSQSPYSTRLQHVPASRTTEEDFVASFLGQK